MSKPAKLNSWPPWLPALLLFAVGAFGLLVLPKLGLVKHPLEGKPAPDFSLPIIYGGDTANRVQLSAYRGRPVILDFWASWCGPCRAQFPVIEDFAQSHGADAVAVVGVNTGDQMGPALRFAQAQGVHYPVVFDEGAVFSSYLGQQLPTLVVIAADGTVAAVRTGFTPRPMLEELLKSAQR